ncbi:MAG: hypothetical protein CR991_04020 [Proteobacteria bacterium]|nr:MAG: hypothetical protein CR991_04020 [Pseudomonadota bacterium]
MSLIKRRCHVNLPLTTAGLYLHRRGFTPQKPALLCRVNMCNISVISYILFIFT